VETAFDSNGYRVALLSTSSTRKQAAEILAIAFLLATSAGILATMLTGLSTTHRWALTVLLALAALALFGRLTQEGSSALMIAEMTVVYDQNRNFMDEPNQAASRSAHSRFVPIVGSTSSKASGKHQVMGMVNFATLRDPSKHPSKSDSDEGDAIRNRVLDAVESAVWAFLASRYGRGWSIRHMFPGGKLNKFGMRREPSVRIDLRALHELEPDNPVLGTLLDSDKLPPEFLAPKSVRVKRQRTLSPPMRDVRLKTRQVDVRIRIVSMMVVPLRDTTGDENDRYVEHTVMVQLTAATGVWGFLTKNASKEADWANDLLGSLHAHLASSGDEGQ